MIDYKEAQKVFRYNPVTGVFKRVLKKSFKRNYYTCDFTPTSVTGWGYLQVSFNGRPNVIHRIIYSMMTNSDIPEGFDVDHIDGDRLNNKWNNIRLVTRSDNLKNMGVKSTNTSGHHGVSRRSDTGSYHAYINSNGKRIHLGNFPGFEEAVAARKVAENVHGFHQNHGSRNAWQK